MGLEVSAHTWTSTTPDGTWISNCYLLIGPGGQWSWQIVRPLYPLLSSANRSLGSKCIELYDGYDLPACKKVELYREKAELWFTKAPHLLVTHGKYPSRNGPSHSSGRCASCFKSNYLGAEWALPGKKVPFSISIFATKVQLSNLTLPTEDLASKKQLRICLSALYCWFHLLTKGWDLLESSQSHF